jgi:ankyrin repeat protein
VYSGASKGAFVRLCSFFLTSIAMLAQDSGPPAIMRAVVYEKADSVKTLLQKGADPNAKDARDATALMWAIPDLAKVRALVAAGADVNARSSNRGLTPLLIASSYPGTVEILKLLLAKGADLRARTKSGQSALTLAATSADVTVVRFLVESGLVPNETAAAGPTAGRVLSGASLARRYTPTLDYLRSQGVKIRPQDLTRLSTHETKVVASFTSLMDDVNSTSGRFRLTPLINAAASEDAPLSTLQLLLDKGANPNLADSEGETALDWAMHRSDRARIALLQKFGAKPAQTPRDVTFSNPEGAPDARTAIQRSVAALLPAAKAVFSRRACITCHNQTMPAQVAAIARVKGIELDEGLAKLNMRQIAGTYKPIGEEALQGGSPPGQELTIGYVAMALAAENYPPDLMTAGLSHMVAARQMPDGSWPEFENRPPMEYSTISRTAMAVRVLTSYPIASRAKETEERLRKARAWLLASNPASAEEYAMRLMGLAWTKLPPADLQREAKTWKAQQKSDGGWAQLPHLESDAYATGITLFAFHEAGFSVSEPAYQKAVAYLLKTQHANGGWFVRTRSFPVQDQFESGFPFGYHQWISSAATSWAAMAIAYTLPDRTPTARSSR